MCIISLMIFCLTSSSSFTLSSPAAASVSSVNEEMLVLQHVEELRERGGGEDSGTRGRQMMQYAWAHFWQRGEGKGL